MTGRVTVKHELSLFSVPHEASAQLNLPARSWEHKKSFTHADTETQAHGDVYQLPLERSVLR